MRFRSCRGRGEQRGVPQIEVVMTTKTACALLGVPRATHYRHRRPKIFGAAPPPARGAQPAALTAAERQHVMDVLNSPRFADKSPAQVWAVSP